MPKFGQILTEKAHEVRFLSLKSDFPESTSAIFCLDKDAVIKYDH